MKKNHSFLIPFLTAMTVIGMSGCNGNEPDPPTETTFELTQDTVRIAAEGGVASIDYRLVEPQEDALVQPDTEADWIGEWNTSVEGTISFEVAANQDTLERETEVTVVYADIQDSFTVIQDGTEGGDEPEPPVESPFKITIDECSSSVVTVSVSPENKDITYDLGAITPASLNVFPDDIAFVEEYLIPYYEQVAAANNMTTEEFLSEWLLIGDKSGQQIAGLSAETEYYVYCIGLTTQCEITTEFVKEPFTTPELSRFDATINVEVDGPDAITIIDPADDTEGYYATIFEGKGHDDETLVYSAQQSIESQVITYALWGLTREMVVALLTHTGTDTLSNNLKALSDYTAAAFTMDANGYITSNPVINEFTTGETPQSDNIISVTWDKVGGRRIDYTVHTTNNDPYVFFLYEYADSFKNMTDDEIIEWICANEDMDFYTRPGGYVSTYADGLRPNTEYVVYAFGYSGGNPNTELFTFTTTTIEAVQNDSTFEYEYGPYFNGDEAAEKYPNSLSGAAGKVVFPASYKITGDWYGIWHDLYLGDLTNKEEYPDEDVYQALRANGNTWLSSEVIYLVEYGEVCTLCGFVETEDGNFSALYRQLVGPFTEDGCSPIDEFNNPELSSASAPQTGISNIKFYEPLGSMWSIKGEVKPALNNAKPKTEAASEDEKYGAEKVIDTNGINFRARIK